MNEILLYNTFVSIVGNVIQAPLLHGCIAMSVARFDRAFYYAFRCVGSIRNILIVKVMIPSVSRDDARSVTRVTNIAKAINTQGQRWYMIRVMGMSTINREYQVRTRNGIISVICNRPRTGRLAEIKLIIILYISYVLVVWIVHIRILDYNMLVTYTEWTYILVICISHIIGDILVMFLVISQAFMSFPDILLKDDLVLSGEDPIAQCLKGLEQLEEQKKWLVNQPVATRRVHMRRIQAMEKKRLKRLADLRHRSELETKDTLEIPHQLTCKLEQLYNDSQMAALKDCLKAQGITLIQGPPGNDCD